MSNLYQDAILDAKALRASAMANAKAALEEAFEPKIQEMISKHLTEEVAEEEIEEGYGMEEEGAMHDGEVSEDINEQELEEILNQLEELEKPKEESLNEAEGEDEDEEEVEDDEEGDEEAAAEETEEVSDETKVIDITLGDLKQVIQSLMPGQEAMPAAEEPTADSEAEAEVSLEEILDELANEGLEEEADSVHDVAHNGTGYAQGKQAHTKEEGMKTEALEPEGFDQLSDEEKKALAQQYMQARKAGKTDPKIDAAIDALAGKNLAESADMIALIGSSILGALAATGLGITTWAAIKGKLPKTPGKGQGGEFSWTREGKEEMHEAEGLDPEGFDKLSDEEKKALAQQYMDARKAGKTDPAIDKAIDALAGKNLAESADMVALIGSSILGVLAATGLGITTWAAIKGKLPKTPGKGQGGEFSWTRESKELKEAKATIQALRKDLQEVNLLNAKYLYMNKLFKGKSLNESQKVKVINALDRATTVVEVKNIYETLKESLETKKQTIKESVGFASKPAGVAPKANIVEADQFVSRWQKLAGIKK